MKVLAVAALALCMGGCQSGMLSKGGEDVTLLNDRSTLPPGAVFIASNQATMGSFQRTKHAKNWARSWTASVGGNYAVADIELVQTAVNITNIHVTVDAYKD